MSKQLPECEKAPAYVYPSLSWQEQQKNDFSKIRLYIAKLREEIARSKRPKKKLDIELVFLITLDWFFYNFKHL